MSCQLCLIKNIMKRGSNVILEFSDKIIRVNEQEKKYITSISTGKQLFTYSFDIDVNGKCNLDKFQQLINKYTKENLNQLDTDNNVIRKFRITNSSYTYAEISNDENNQYHYTIEISEHEELTTSILTIAGVACAVLSYNEEIDQATSAIIINAVIKQTEEDREKINGSIAKNTYFDVVRNDISDKVLKMRFGKTIWSKHDGFIKRKIVLVQENYDEAELESKLLSLGINEPEIMNIQKCLALQIRYTVLLEDLLINKGIISTDEIAKIKLQVEDTYMDSFRDYYLVDDVENYD